MFYALISIFITNQSYKVDAYFLKGNSDEGISLSIFIRTHSAWRFLKEPTIDIFLINNVYKEENKEKVRNRE